MVRCQAFVKQFFSQPRQPRDFFDECALEIAMKHNETSEQLNYHTAQQAWYVRSAETIRFIR
jgi:hypothetical protein